MYLNANTYGYSNWYLHQDVLPFVHMGGSGSCLNWNGQFNSWYEIYYKSMSDCILFAEQLTFSFEGYFGQLDIFCMNFTVSMWCCLLDLMSTVCQWMSKSNINFFCMCFIWPSVHCFTPAKKAWMNHGQPMVNHGYWPWLNHGSTIGLWNGTTVKSIITGHLAYHTHLPNRTIKSYINHFLELSQTHKLRQWIDDGSLPLKLVLIRLLWYGITH